MSFHVPEPARCPSSAAEQLDGRFGAAGTTVWAELAVDPSRVLATVR